MEVILWGQRIIYYTDYGLENCHPSPRGHSQACLQGGPPQQQRIEEGQMNPHCWIEENASCPPKWRRESSPVIGSPPLCKDQVAVPVSKGSLDLFVSDLAYQNLIVGS
jgi:hypothetical protein